MDTENKHNGTNNIRDSESRRLPEEIRITRRIAKNHLTRTRIEECKKCNRKRILHGRESTIRENIFEIEGYWEIEPKEPQHCPQNKCKWRVTWKKPTKKSQKK